MQPQRSIDNSQNQNPSHAQYLGDTFTRKRWFSTEQRLQFNSAQEAGIDQNTRIGTIRIKTMNPNEHGKQSWNKKKWVQLEIKDSDGTKTNILANVASISKRTGLTKKQIRDKASKGESNFADFLKTNVEKRTVNLVKSIKTEASYGKKRPLFCDRGNKAFDEDIRDEFNLSKSEYKKAKDEGRIQLGDIQTDKASRRKYRDVTFIAPLTDSDLKKVVKKVHKCSRELSNDNAKKSEKEKTMTVSKCKMKKLTINFYITPEANVYLSSLSKYVGRGGFKTVYLGSEVATQQLVVINKPNQPEELDKVQRETQLLKKAEPKNSEFRDFHTCIPITYEDDDFSYGTGHGFISTYYNAGSLENYLETQGNGNTEKEQIENIKTQLLIMQQLVNRLAEIHESGIGHFDIKPDNILLKKNEKEELIFANFADYGLSQEKNKDNEFEEGFHGTVDYMSPRLLFDKRVSEFNDIWALGITFLKMLDPKNVPTFSKIQQIRDDLKNRMNLLSDYKSELNHRGGVDEIHFGKKKPELPNEEGPIDELLDYEIIKIKMIRLCWDMMFTGMTEKNLEGTMTAKDIAAKMNEITAEAKKVKEKYSNAS